MLLLTTTDEKIEGAFLRSLLLAEAFAGTLEDASAQQLLLSIVSDSPKQQGISWEKVWEHYSALANLEASRLRNSLAKRNPLQTQLTSESIQAIFEPLQRIETKMDELKDVLRFDHTVIMERQAEMEKALRELLEKANRAPSDLLNSCRSDVRSILGEMFDKLDPTAPKFLITAEYGYQQYPTEADFSGVVMGFTKAFEVQLKKAIEPFKVKLQNF